MPCGFKTYSSLAGFGEEKVCNKAPDGRQSNEDDVRLPLELLDRHRPGELVGDTSNVGEDTLESHPLGTDFKVDDLDRVQRLERCQVERVDGSEDEDEGQDSVAGRLVAELGVTISHAAGRDRVGQSGGSRSHADPDDGSSPEATEQHLATTNQLHKMSTNDGKGKLEA